MIEHALDCDLDADCSCGALEVTGELLEVTAGGWLLALEVVRTVALVAIAIGVWLL